MHLFAADFTPIEKTFFDLMKELIELYYLHADMLSLEGGATELHLVGVIWKQFANTNDLVVKNYELPRS